MSAPYTANSFVIRLRGLPWNTSQSEVQNFLQGCKIRHIQFLTNDQGRDMGGCFVVTESREDVDLAKSFNKKMMSNRYIEVFDSSSEEMLHMSRNNGHTNNSNSSNNDGWREPVVRLRGLPYGATKDDVIKFFSGLDIAQNGVHISSSKPAGEAFVAFTNMDNALRALDYNRKNMGHRYIEIFKANYAEARDSILTDTHSVMRQKSNNTNQHHGNYSTIPNNSNNPNSYNNSPNSYGNEPSANQYESYSETVVSYPTDTTNPGSMKRSMSSFTIKLRGVPFEAGQKEIFDFFSPVVPIELEQESTPRGRPPIWYAEFGSREEATEAMTFNQKHMGKRYIELFPMYDELNRSKMVGT